MQSLYYNWTRPLTLRLVRRLHRGVRRHQRIPQLAQPYWRTIVPTVLWDYPTISRNIPQLYTPPKIILFVSHIRSCELSHPIVLTRRMNRPCNNCWHEQRHLIQCSMLGSSNTLHMQEDRNNLKKVILAFSVCVGYWMNIIVNFNKQWWTYIF